VGGRELDLLAEAPLDQLHLEIGRRRAAPVGDPPLDRVARPLLLVPGADLVRFVDFDDHRDRRRLEDIGGGQPPLALKVGDRAVAGETELAKRCIA